jgi:hypothetical protein
MTLMARKAAVTPSVRGATLPSWVAMRHLPARPFYPCHVENASFDQALLVFGARPTRFKATVGAPRAGRQFLLRFPSGRYALVANYDDFPHSLEFSLQITNPSRGASVAHVEDLIAVLTPPGLPIPDKSNDGALKWLPASDA